MLVPMGPFPHEVVCAANLHDCGRQRDKAELQARNGASIRSLTHIQMLLRVLRAKHRFVLERLADDPEQPKQENGQEAEDEHEARRGGELCKDEGELALDHIIQ